MSRLTRDKALALARRLRAINDPEAHAIAAELEDLAPGPPHRPVAEDRGMRRAERSRLSHMIYTGTLPADRVPEGFELMVDRAEGSKGEADAVAAEILGASKSSIEKARAEAYPMGQKAWEDFKRWWQGRIRK